MQGCPIGSHVGNKLSPLNALVRQLTGLARNITLVLLCTGGAVLEDDALGRAEALANRGSELEQQGRYDDAIPLTSDALAIREKMLGSDHPDVAKSLNNLAALYVEKGGFAEAEPLYQRSLVILEKARGPENPDVASILDNLGNLYRAQGRYAEAETLVRRALAIRENAFGSEDPKIAKSLNNLASLAFAQGHYADAEPLFQRSLAIWEKALGTDHPEVANTLSNLAVLYDAEGRFDQAESLYRRSLAIREKALGPEHPDIADTLNNLAEVYAAQALYSEAEPLLMRSLAIREKALGPEHPKVAESLNNLAQLYFSLGRDAEAETFFKRSLAIYEKAVGPDHPDVAMSLSNLAAVYIGQRRFDAAEPLFRRSLAIREKALGPDHPDVAVSLNNLADVYRNTQRYGAAEPLYQRSAAIWEKAFGSEHPDLGRSLNNLAEVYRKNGRYGEAEPLFKRGLAIFEKALGEEHPMVALSLNNLAALYEDEGRDAEAEPLFKRSLAIDRKAFGPEHHDIVLALWNLAALYRKQQRITEARSLVNEAIGIVAHRLAVAGSALSGNGGTGDQREFRSLFLMSVALAGQQADAGPLPIGDSFRLAQLATASSTATAVAGMAARFAAGSDALAAVVRERQDLAQRWHGLDSAIVQAASKPPQQRDPAAEGSLRKELAETESRLNSLDTRIAREFSAYAELSSPEPLELAATQAMLTPDEALLVYLVGQDESWLWALRRDKAERYKLDIGATGLSAEVAGLRERLDPDLNPDMLPFDAKRANALYQRILGPAATLLDGANQVFVIPDGALESLPMGVLVTRPPEHDPQDLGDYRDLSWFAREHALAVLPSVGALRELRQYSAAGHPAAAPFVGIGNPVLGGRLASARGVKLATLFRGPLADTQAVRALPALPETADELRTVAKAMGAGKEDLYLAERASEPLLRKAGLDNYRVVEFATHGLISGDLKGLAEPALVLTPPEKPTSDNDGLLTASKIATFKLNADWVVLSACNTAAGDGTPDAGGLSGLAKAFFYAGARSILVSHWSVPSEATVKLITSTFAELQKDPAIGRAEALRRAEMAMLDPKSPPEFAHPLAWAAFVLAGEGGAGR
jgi:CHAT domain-containing protein/Tfp pilus assembly protein PilF